MDNPGIDFERPRHSERFPYVCRTCGRTVSTDEVVAWSDDFDATLILLRSRQCRECGTSDQKGVISNEASNADRARADAAAEPGSS